MPPYRYSPLNEEAKEIRLLTLLPGEFTSEIHVDIDIVPFRVDKPPNFEALSYTWGSTDNPVDIFIEPQNATLKVTRNLAEALPYLRYQDKPRVLWIDAIAIDQSNLEERSRQVERMVDLYTLATRVVIWLGSESNDSAQALELLNEVASYVLVDWRRLAMSPSNPEVNPEWADMKIALPYGSREWELLGSVLHRPWFDRLWIWQEARLASSDALLMCGFDSIAWQAFRRASVASSVK